MLEGLGGGRPGKRSAPYAAALAWEGWRLRWLRPACGLDEGGPWTAELRGSGKCPWVSANGGQQPW